MLKKILGLLLALYAAMAFAAVDVNSADATQLDSVKGIGPAIAGKITAERAKAPFKDWDDLITRVSGIGDKTAAKLSEGGLTVNGATFKGVAAKPAAAPAAKPAATTAATPAMPAAPAAKPADAKAPAVTAATTAATTSAMSADDKKAAAKKAKEDKAAAKKKDKEDKAAAAKAAKDEKAAKAAAAKAPASAPAAKK